MPVIEVTARPVLLLGWDSTRKVSPTGVSGGVSFGTAKINVKVAATGIASSATVGSPTLANNLVYGYPDGVAGSTTTGDPKVNAKIALAGIASTAATGQLKLNTKLVGQGIGLTLTLGQPAAVFSFGVTGISSGVAFGTPKVNTSLSTTGIASTLLFGTLNLKTLVKPTGISAGTGVVGGPTLVTIVRPSGTASSLQMGTVLFIARIFVDVDDLESTIQFGAPTLTNRRRFFRTPRNTYQWRLFKEYEGISLLKENGVWVEVAHPDLQRTLTAEMYLGGGRDHYLPGAVMEELAAAGYPYIEEIVP